MLPNRDLPIHEVNECKLVRLTEKTIEFSSADFIQTNTLKFFPTHRGTNPAAKLDLISKVLASSSK
jgi:hypothetical protein